MKVCRVILGSLALITGLACSDDAGTQDVGDELGTGSEDDVGSTGSDAETSSEGETTASMSDSSSTTDSTDTTDTASTSDSTETTTDTTDSTDTGEPMGADYAQLGPYSVSTSGGSMQASPNCNLEYEVFEPDTLLSDTAVVLAHGFMRSIDDMAETAEHIASWGVKVYAVPLCTNSFQINHQVNGEAIAALGQALEPAGPVYAGFSAGGLATWVAAASDPNTVGYVGLDAVDSGNLGGMFAGQLDAPIRGVVAEPGQCNTNNNFLPIYASKASAPVIRVVDAQHFDFETSSCGIGDFACSLCAPNGPEARATALGLVTSAILIETGADLGGATWWEPGGAYFNSLAQQGKIQLIQ